MTWKNGSPILITGVLLSVMIGCAASRDSTRSAGSDSVRAAKAGPISGNVAGQTPREQAMFEAFTRQESEFRKHYDGHYAQSGYAYNQFRPAYQQGFELGFDPRNRDLDWNSIETEARKGWNESRMGLWDRYKDAVRYGWERGVVAARG